MGCCESAHVISAPPRAGREREPVPPRPPPHGRPREVALRPLGNSLSRNGFRGRVRTTVRVLGGVVAGPIEEGETSPESALGQPPRGLQQTAEPFAPIAWVRIPPRPGPTPRPRPTPASAPTPQSHTQTASDAAAAHPLVPPPTAPAARSPAPACTPPGSVVPCARTRPSVPHSLPCSRLYHASSLASSWDLPTPRVLAMCRRIAVGSSYIE
jgi:hypothetical protein